MNNCNPYNCAKNKIYYEITIKKVEISECEKIQAPVDSYSGILTEETLYSQKFETINVSESIKSLNDLNYIK